jgi:hypothetical protein
MELVKNEERSGFEYKSRTPSLVHHLYFWSPYSKPPSLLTMPPFVVILSLSLVLKLDIHFDGGCVQSVLWIIFWRFDWLGQVRVSLWLWWKSKEYHSITKTSKENRGLELAFEGFKCHETLGLRPPRQMHGRVLAKSATEEPHLHSQECEGMNPHILKWTPTLGVRILMESRIFKDIFQGSKLIGLKNYLYHWKNLENYMSKMGLHDPFEYLKHKLWPKERLRVKVSIWFPTIKNQESS